MEPYFNDVCEAYFIQTNGNNNYPLNTELPSLNLDMEDELEAESLIEYKYIKGFFLHK